MTETGLSKTGKKRKVQQHSVPRSFVATEQEEKDLQDSMTCVDITVDSGILYLNPLTPKWNSGIAGTSLDISSEEEEEIWVQSKDNGELDLAEKAKTSNRLTLKLKHVKGNKHNSIQQTPNGISMNNIADISSTSSDEICVQNLDNVKGRKAKKQHLVSKLRLRKVQKHHLNERYTIVKSGIISNCYNIPTSSSEEKDIWVQIDDNAESTLTKTAKQVTPEINVTVKDCCTNPQTKQSTDEKSPIIKNCALNLSSESEETNISAKNNEETTMAENDKQVMSKLKDLHVKNDNGADVSAKDLCKDDAKMSRLLEAMKKRGDIDSEQRPFKCTHCHWAFKKLCYLQSHLTTHSGLKPHVCDKCGKAYSHQGTLQQHKRLHTGERPYRCPFCDRSYIWSSDYRKHIRTHTGEKPYECKECGKDFIRSSDLRKHERNMHTNNKPFQCSHCDKTFNRPLSLKRHERKHLGERPYSCSDCGKKFALESRMVEHQKIHNGVRPFVCSVCAKCFTKSSNLTEHEAIHSGKRPHKCGECGIAFAMAARLVRHQYTHNVGTIHSCGGCNKNFSCLANLEQHQQLNCAGRIFVCVQCDKSFRCAEKLAQHMQHHNHSSELLRTHAMPQ
ncbi:uncharacterized protein znf648 [Eucyclogobius newberryi]|uniref:uncharacterized protein znf648 n=1 Tax=Eucyclogobius newberryi TaxID=166745 RepID=UPI003B59B591